MARQRHASSSSLVHGYIHKRRIEVSLEKIFMNMTEPDKSFK
jgi:hypothetical protein